MLASGLCIFSNRCVHAFIHTHTHTHTHRERERERETDRERTRSSVTNCKVVEYTHTELYINSCF